MIVGAARIATVKTNASRYKRVRVYRFERTGDTWSQGQGLERVMGIEPTLVAWEATVLPLNYTRWPALILCRSRGVGKSTIQPARQSSGPRLRRRRSDAPA